MNPLAWIVALTVAGGVLGVLGAGVLLLLSDRVRERLLPALLSFAVGTLLGGAFLALLPHALEAAGVTAHGIALTVLIALLGFFLLEKMVIWRHCHTYDCEVHGSPGDGAAHAHDGAVEQARNAAAGSLILVGDGIHNFVDGVLIAAAFLADVHLGIVTAIAVIAHEVPQELGDFAVLLMSGYSRARALLYNALSGLTMVAGGVAAYFSLSWVLAAIPYVLAAAAASFIYIAVADLIPGLHRRPALSATAQQLVLIAAGVLVILFADRAMH
ncbi:MAG TPA: ZIP family metal transporter [Burkholderiales bacterium]